MIVIFKYCIIWIGCLRLISIDAIVDKLSYIRLHFFTRLIKILKTIMIDQENVRLYIVKVMALY